MELSDWKLGNLGPDASKAAEEILGYVNFSSGTADPHFLENVDRLFGLIGASAESPQPTWQALGAFLHAQLQRLHESSEAFASTEQAEGVLRLVFDETLPAYRRYHGDLLAHQTDEALFQPFFLGRVFQAVLQQQGSWWETGRIVPGAISQLNDFLGYRPVAVLESEQKIQPYEHEYVGAIPLYVRGAGVAAGRYRELIEKALEILGAAESSLLFQAWFDPALLDELAVDPRAYDFDHPAHKRPNQMFGQWDMLRLDNSGMSRRFVLQEVSLKAMLARVESHGKLPREELLFEAASVLAGTMLMGSGVSGNRPDAHGSNATLAGLVQHIAAYRDAFYEQLINRLSGPRAARLRAEEKAMKQPFGGVRQDFNQYLVARRAQQMQHVQLAQLYARMGNWDAAALQVRRVPVVSARMECDLHCRLIATFEEIRQGRLTEAADMLPEIEPLLHRAIRCGAVVDPWNMLGFDAQFSLFPAPENSVPDHRIEELLELMSQLFDLHVCLQREAAATGENALCETVAGRLRKLAEWWDQFASTAVGSVEGISGQETTESADHVAAVLKARREAGTAAGDVPFWQSQAGVFRSPKAYALVVEALIDQNDLIAAMALLVQWVSQAESIPLAEENYSFHELAMRWMDALWANAEKTSAEKTSAEKTDGKETPPEDSPGDPWALSRKFLDYLESNAEAYWDVPRFELTDENSEESDSEEDADEDLFSAAYEDVTYHDTTDDGFEGETFEGGAPLTNFELLAEGERIENRLDFLACVARLWKQAAAASMAESGSDPARDEILADWLHRAKTNRRELIKLLDAFNRYQIPLPRGTHESLVEYDHHQSVKELLLERIITACVETVDTVQVIRVTMQDPGPPNGSDDWEELAGRVLRAVIHADRDAVKEHWDDLTAALLKKPLLYVALAKGGKPQRIVASRSIQCVIERLLIYLPRLGLLHKTSQLIETVQNMELSHPVGDGAITEFDRLFQIGCKALIRCLVLSSEDWSADAPKKRHRDFQLVQCLEQTTESLLQSWLVHSQSVRLSVMESVREGSRWRKLKQFIQRYGRDLFTQQYLGLGNIRAILHEGVDIYLESLAEEPDAGDELRLLAELGGKLPHDEAVNYLGFVLEAVAENYAEYVDYNSITTQSDRGDMLYTLLDFLRLRVEYDRMAWNLLPVVLAHQVLVRNGWEQAAASWRSAVVERTDDIAEGFQDRFAQLCRKYGMRLPSIADRLAERFVRPLHIDRLCALIRPAVEELRVGESATFERLDQAIVEFTADLTDPGLEVPVWLEALQQEAEQAQYPLDDEPLDPQFHVPQVHLTLEQAQREINRMPRKQRPKKK